MYNKNMNKEIRKLNKYERAYLNRVKKLYKRKYH